MRIEVNVLINRPVEEVWDFYADLRNSPAGSSGERGLAEDELLDLARGEKRVRPEETEYLDVARRP